VSAGKVMAAAKPVRADAPGWSPAPARAGSGSQENQRKPVVPARTPTHAALPVAASGPVARASASGSSLSAAAKRALQALEEEDAADDDGFELSVTDSGERSGVRERVQAGEAGAAVSGAALAGALVRERKATPTGEAAPSTPLHATISPAEMAAAALRAGSSPMSGGRGTTWPKEHVPVARSEPAAAPARPPRSRVYLVGLAASLLLLLVGRSLLNPWSAGGDGGPERAPTSTLDGERVHDDDSKLLAERRLQDLGTTMSRPRETTGVAPSAAEVTASGSTSAAETDEPNPTAEPLVPTVEPRPRSVAEQVDEGCRQVRFGDARRGVEQLLAAHDRAPGGMQLQLCIADGYAKLGKYESALRFYNDLLAEYPRHVKGLRGAAQANEYLDRRPAAAALYQRLLVHEPRDKSALAFFASEAERDAGEPGR
jgi:hypothetical protein